MQFLKKCRLCFVEQKILSAFRLGGTLDNLNHLNSTTKLTIIEHILKWLHLEQYKTPSKTLETRFMFSASIIDMEMFSTTRHALTNHRECNLVAKLKLKMFLFTN